jgi:NAD(P)-dependent dehydrogenase (short-subunit alcohol dehydrogenase family)
VNEVAVVVGATGALGGAIVDRLVARGLGVVAVARDPERLRGLVERAGPAVEACAADIGRDEATEGVRRAIGGRTVRAVVHGPGVIVAGGVLTAPIEAILASVDIKVGGLLRVVRAADPHLVAGSRIVAIAGHYGLEPSAHAATAGVANAALVNVSRQLSLAYGPRGVTAHTLAPGPVDTPRLRRVAADRAAHTGASVEEVLAEIRAGSSHGRLTTAAEVAWAVGVLLDPEAAATTGATFFLDSGLRRGLP